MSPLPEEVKKPLIALLGAAAALLAALAIWIGSSTSQPPEPLPSPSPNVSLLPSPSPSTTASVTPSVTPAPVVSHSVSPSPSATPTAFAGTLRLLDGSTDGLEVTAQAPGPGTLTLPGLSVQAFEIRQVETLVPSFRGARVGAYGDALFPATSVAVGTRYWLDVRATAPGTQVASLYGVPVRVEVLAQRYTQPLPFYMELQFAQVARAHNLPDTGETFEQRITLAKQYIALLRAHGVEPIKQGVTVYPDITLTGLRYKELVLDGAIAPPMLWGPAPGNPPPLALLQAVEARLRAGTLPAGSMAYVWDEGEGTRDAEALAASQHVKNNAPSLRVFITRQASAQFNPFVDVYCPVQNWFNQPGQVPASAYAGKTLCLYGSCMANGNCHNHASAANVAPATRFPMMVIDAPAEDPARYVREMAAAGASMLLYFNSTQRMPTALQPGGQYNEGGNGDGTLLYANQGVSVRLKGIRKGLLDVAFSRLGLTR